MPSEENPADILSRGATLSEFKKSHLWRFGPHWLINRKLWPIWSGSQFKTTTIAHPTVAATERLADEKGIGNIIDPSKYSYASTSHCPNIPSSHESQDERCFTTNVETPNPRCSRPPKGRKCMDSFFPA